MGPITQQLFNDIELVVPLNPAEAKRARDYILKCAHFYISRDFMDTIIEIVSAFPITDSFSGKMPHDDVVIEIEDTGLFILGPDTALGKDVVAMTSYAPGGDATGVGHWRPGTMMVGITKKQEEAILSRGEDLKTSEEFNDAWAAAQTLSTLLELLCEPRITTLGKPSRPLRRQAERLVARTGSELPTVFATVGWTIGDKTTGRGNTPPESGGRKPFHLVRGHWRDYDDRHTPKSVQRKGRPGWWVWIESHWSGSPAYGVIGHNYRPKIDPDKSARAMLDLALSRTGV